MIAHLALPLSLELAAQKFALAKFGLAEPGFTEVRAFVLRSIESLELVVAAQTLCFEPVHGALTDGWIVWLLRAGAAAAASASRSHLHLARCIASRFCRWIAGMVWSTVSALVRSMPVTAR
jgi:hypothetical protein